MIQNNTLKIQTVHVQAPKKIAVIILKMLIQ